MLFPISQRSALSRLSSLLLGAAILLSAAAPAAAVTFNLTREFDGIEPDAIYATVVVNENAGDLEFEITLNGLLGAGEDLHELYFNVIGTLTNPVITASNAPTTAYTLELNPSVNGGAGSSFDVGVNFGNGGSVNGNGALTFATFTLSADETLSVNDLLESSFTSQGIEAQMAIHVQGTDTPPGSETVGGVPEPGFGLLLGLGGALLVARRRA